MPPTYLISVALIFSFNSTEHRRSPFSAEAIALLYSNRFIAINFVNIANNFDKFQTIYISHVLKPIYHVWTTFGKWRLMLKPARVD